MMINASAVKMPMVASEEWEHSKFKVSKGVLILASAVGTVSAGFNCYLNASRLSAGLLIINIVVIIGSFIFGAVRSKYAHVEVSFEKA